MALELLEKNVVRSVKDSETGFLVLAEIPAVIIKDAEHDLLVIFEASHKPLAEKMHAFLQTLSEEEFGVVSEKFSSKLSSHPTDERIPPGKYRRYEK